MKIVGEPAVIPSLGSVYVTFGNVPYGLLLGNLFYFGFLEYDYAFMCYKILTFALILFTVYEAYKYFDKHLPKNIKKKAFYYFMLMTVLSINIYGPLNIGNNGHLLCMLLIISIFNVDNNDILSGICLSLAMIKPQIAILLVISLLLYKKYKPVLIAALIDVSASFLCAFLVKEDIFSLFSDSISMNSSLYNKPSFGMLSFLNISNTQGTMIYSMLLGIIVVFGCYKFLRKDTLTVIKFSYPVLMSAHWCYGWSSDYYMMILGSISFIILYLMIDNKLIKVKKLVGGEKLCKLYLMMSALFVIFTWCVKYVLKKPYIYRLLNLAYHDEWYRNLEAGLIIGIVYIFIIISSIYVINKLEYKKFL